MVNWTLEQTYFVTEIVGMVFVVISLLAVFIQLRQNTQIVRASSATQGVEGLAQSWRMLAQDAELMELVLKGLEDPSRLDGVDRARWYSYFSSSWWGLQSSYNQWRNGLLDDDYWHSYKSLFVDLKDQPGLQKHWIDRKHWMSEDFRQYVETEIMTAPATSDYKPWGVANSKIEKTVENNE